MHVCFLVRSNEWKGAYSAVNLVYESALGVTAPRPNWGLVSTDAA